MLASTQLALCWPDSGNKPVQVVPESSDSFAKFTIQQPDVPGNETASPLALPDGAANRGRLHIRVARLKCRIVREGCLVHLRPVSIFTYGRALRRILPPPPSHPLPDPVALSLRATVPAKGEGD